MDEQNVPPVVTPKFTVQNPPKTKEDWQTLAKEDPATWQDLTQSRMDQIVRESRETKEKLTASEQRAENLRAEIDSLKKPREPELKPDEGEKGWGTNNLPKNKEEWEELSITDPVLFADLRDFSREKERTQRDTQTRVAQEYETEQSKYRKEVQSGHPEMYQPETDGEGKPKLDGNGKPILKINPTTGEPIFNAESEKGKLWIQIFNEDPQTYSGSKKGPKLIMLELERRLKDSGQKQLDQSKGTPEPDQRGTLPEGVPPPQSRKVSFNSDEEKSHAEGQVRRGLYKNLEEYCENRDRKDTGIIEKGRVPQFGKP